MRHSREKHDEMSLGFCRGLESALGYPFMLQ